MAPICMAAAEVLDQITFGLAVGEIRKVEGADWGEACVWVGRLADDEHGMAFSVGRYVVADGNVEADPEMVFLRATDGWQPLTYRCGKTYRKAVMRTDAGALKPVSGVHLRLVRMANVWMRRIRVMIAARNGVGAK